MVLVDFKYAYFVLVIPFLLVWLLLFIFSKDTRKEQLWMSLLLAPFGPVSELIYFKDYWLPQSILSFNVGTFPVFVEDILFAFAIGGIGGIIYEALFRRHLLKLSRPVHYKIGLPMIVLLATAVALTLFFVGLNSIFATSAGFVVATGLVIAQRKDLLVDSLVSGLAVMLTMMLTYLILFNIVANTDDLFRQGWLLYDTPLDIRLFDSVPLTEMVWGFSWGLIAGPLYEFLKRLKVS
jgi:hypothetical protein